LASNNTNEAVRDLEKSHDLKHVLERLTHVQASSDKIIKMCEGCTASDPTVTGFTSVNRDDSSQLRTSLPIMLRFLRIAAMSLHILPSLMYDEMDMRGERIPQAHADTFGWVFDNETLGFTDWLADANGGSWNLRCSIHKITDAFQGFFGSQASLDLANRH
jgi:hypothetical protein